MIKILSLVILKAMLPLILKQVAAVKEKLHVINAVKPTTNDADSTEFTYYLTKEYTKEI